MRVGLGSNEWLSNGSNTPPPNQIDKNTCKLLKWKWLQTHWNRSIENYVTCNAHNSMWAMVFFFLLFVPIRSTVFVYSICLPLEWVEPKHQLRILFDYYKIHLKEAKFETHKIARDICVKEKATEEDKATADTNVTRQRTCRFTLISSLGLGCVS